MMAELPDWPPRLPVVRYKTAAMIVWERACEKANLGRRESRNARNARLSKAPAYTGMHNVIPPIPEGELPWNTEDE